MRADDRDELQGVALLRERRGDELVTFGDVADHLQDFVRRDPSTEPVVDRLAAFLAVVEALPHGHEDGEAGSTLS
jgi:hypothetical protein